MASRAIGAIAALGGLLLAAVPVHRQEGAYALATGTPEIVSEMQRVAENEVSVTQYRAGSNTPIKQYTGFDGPQMHFVLVRDDFRSFAHAHPVMQRSGAFLAHVTLDEGHRFYAFAGTTPAGLQPQVFRFVLQAGEPRHGLAATLVAPTSTAHAGPYTVTLSSADVSAHHPGTIAVSIRRGNTPQHVHADLTLIDTSRLRYLEPEEGPIDAFGVPPLPSGLYRAWVQFRADGVIRTAPFTLLSR